MAEFSDLSILSHDNRIVRSNNIAGADHNLTFLDDTLLVHTSGRTRSRRISPTRRSTRAIPYTPTGGNG